MADLSEKLGLESAEDVSLAIWDKANHSTSQSMGELEADRRATVEAVAQWLRKHDPSTPGGPRSWDLVRELLSPSPGEGRPEAGETWLLECPWPECRHRWESGVASLHYKSCPGCHNSLTFNGARVIRFPESEPEANDGE